MGCIIIAKKEYPHFKDRSLFGDFEITIDRNKKITLVNSSIGEERSIVRVTEEELADYYKRLPCPEEKSKEQKARDARYDQIEHCLLKNEPLTGKTLELALEFVDVNGDDEFSIFTRNIGVKMKAGQPLDEYEYHIMVDVLLLHARLGV